MASAGKLDVVRFTDFYLMRRAQEEFDTRNAVCDIYRKLLAANDAKKIRIFALSVFKAIDTDQSGNLDTNEIKQFLTGLQTRKGEVPIGCDVAPHL